MFQIFILRLSEREVLTAEERPSPVLLRRDSGTHPAPPDQEPSFVPVQVLNTSAS